MYTPLIEFIAYFHHITVQEEYDQRNKEEDKKRQEIAAKFQVFLRIPYSYLLENTKL